MRALAGDHHVPCRGQGVGKVARAREDVEKRRGASIHRTRQRLHLRPLVVDAQLQARDLLIERGDLVLQIPDRQLLLGDLGGEQLRPHRRGGDSVAQVVLCGQRCGQVTAETLRQLVECRLRACARTGRGCARAGARAYGRCGSRCRHAKRERCGANRGRQRQRGYASHARTRLKLRTAVAMPSTMPAMTTPAITKRVAVRPTPGSSCTYVASAKRIASR